MTHDSSLTRRKVLASIGAVGLLTTGAGVARALRGEPPYTHYTVAQVAADTPNLRVAWYETYNGVVQERSSAGIAPDNASFETAAADGEFVDDDAPGYVDTGPVIDFADLLPGDSGTLVVGLESVDAPGDVWFRPYAPATVDDGSGTLVNNYRENGLIEPEVAANDVTLDEGELQDALYVEVWYDRGVAGVGGCDGTRQTVDLGFDVGEPLVGTDGLVVAGTLREVSDRFPEGVPLFDGCLETSDPRCLGISWELPEGTSNAVQTDGVTFELQFAAGQCLDGRSSPFASNGGVA